MQKTPCMDASGGCANTERLSSRLVIRCHLGACPSVLQLLPGALKCLVFPCLASEDLSASH